MLVLFHSDVVIDRGALRRLLPEATGQALVETHGGEADRWQAAYRQIQADWDSYWADLTLDGDDSLVQWREGHFRVVRAVFRLVRMEVPAADRIAWFVGDLPRLVGQHCSALKDGCTEMVRALRINGISVGIVAPTLSSGFVRGMLGVADLEDTMEIVLGPDEIGQVGLEGIAGSWLADLAGVPASEIRLISPVSVSGLITITPPASFHTIPDLILSREQST